MNRLTVRKVIISGLKEIEEEKYISNINNKKDFRRSLKGFPFANKVKKEAENMESYTILERTFISTYAPFTIYKFYLEIEKSFKEIEKERRNALVKEDRKNIKEKRKKQQEKEIEKTLKVYKDFIESKTFEENKIIVKNNLGEVLEIVFISKTGQLYSDVPTLLIYNRDKKEISIKTDHSKIHTLEELIKLKNLKREFLIINTKNFDLTSIKNILKKSLIATEEILVKKNSI